MTIRMVLSRDAFSTLYVVIKKKNKLLIKEIFDNTQIYFYGSMFNKPRRVSKE